MVLLTRRANLGRVGTTVLWLAELAVLIAAFVLLRWTGLILAIAVLVTAGLISAVRLAAQLESSLIAATTRGKLDMSKEEVGDFHRELHRSDRVFAHMNKLQTAELIRTLSESGRAAFEIRDMAPWITKLWLIGGIRDGLQREQFARRFDRCMRLWRIPAEGSEGLADKVLVSAKQSAASIDEMLDGLIAMQDPALE